MDFDVKQVPGIPCNLKLVSPIGQRLKIKPLTPVTFDDVGIHLLENLYVELRATGDESAFYTKVFEQIDLGTLALFKDGPLVEISGNVASLVECVRVGDPKRIKFYCSYLGLTRVKFSTSSELKKIG